MSHPRTDTPSSLVSLHVGETSAQIILANGPLNLVTRPMLRDLNQALRKLRHRTDLRYVVVHGGDAKAFCAGSDIKEFAHLREHASEEKILFEDMVVQALADLPMPAIAALDGPALGGGLELALACDLRVMRQGTCLGLTEARLGGLAGSGSVRLARLVGPARAKELLFTAAIIEADQAFEWGIVNRICQGAALDCAIALGEEIAQRGPLSNRFGKALVDASLDRPLACALSLSTQLQQHIFESQDLHAGMQAFFSKRDAVFVGG